MEFLFSDDVVLTYMCGCKACVLLGFSDLCCEKWACKKPTDYLDESAQFQDLREDDNSASEITYGEVEQRLGQLQEHLSRYIYICIYLFERHVVKSQ